MTAGLIPSGHLYQPHPGGNVVKGHLAQAEAHSTISFWPMKTAERGESLTDLWGSQ
jgi:hypothetical protein